MESEQLLAVFVKCRFESKLGDEVINLCGTYDVSSWILQISGQRVTMDVQRPFILAMLSMLRLENIIDDKLLQVSGTYDASSQKWYVGGIRMVGMVEELSEESVQLLCLSAEVEYEDESAIGHNTYKVQVNKHGLTRMPPSTTSKSASPPISLPSS